MHLHFQHARHPSKVKELLIESFNVLLSDQQNFSRQNRLCVVRHNLTEMCNAVPILNDRYFVS
jgi:hypothetical protein